MTFERYRYREAGDVGKDVGYETAHMWGVLQDNMEAQVLLNEKNRITMNFLK